MVPEAEAGVPGGGGVVSGSGVLGGASAGAFGQADGAAWAGLDAVVVDWAGPWPVAERWWTPRGRRRVFLQVVVDGEPTLGLLLSATAGAWSLEALYD